MSKLNWSRASERSLDPARYQRRNDFCTRDQRTYSEPMKRKAAKPAQLRKQAEHKARMKVIQEEKKRKKLKTAQQEAEFALRALGRKQKKAAAVKKRRLENVKRKAKIEALRAAYEEYQKTPEYAAKIARERAKMAAKTAAKEKSYLELWIKQKTGLGADREFLNEQWRDLLLKRPMPQA